MNERAYQTFKVNLRNMGPQNAVEVRALVKTMAGTFTYLKWLAILFLLIGIPLSFVLLGIPLVVAGLILVYLGLTVPRKYVAYGERYIEEYQMTTSSVSEA